MQSSQSGLMITSALEILLLSRNRLVGRIPTEIGHLSHLTMADLSLNRLSSTLPSQLSKIASLEELILHENYFEGSVEDLLFASDSLMVLSLEENDLLTGTMPASLCHLDALGFNCRADLCGCWCDCSMSPSNSTT
jgi:hypothetical protein